MNSREINGLGEIMREYGEDRKAADDQVRIICVDDEQTAEAMNRLPSQCYRIMPAS
jgi:hypothetical protein